jgi:hypothetical protein
MRKSRKQTRKKLKGGMYNGEAAAVTNNPQWYVRFDPTGWHPARPYQVEAVLNYVSGNSSKEVIDTAGTKFNVTFDVNQYGAIVYTPLEGPTAGKTVEMTFAKPNQIANINRLTT